MEDDVVTINLGNGSFVDRQGKSATYTKSLTVDYTQGTVSGNFKVEGDGFGDSGNFSRQLVQDGNNYTATGEGFSVFYTGKAPSTARIQLVANNNETYDTNNNPESQRNPPVTSDVQSGTVCFAAGTRIRVARDGCVCDVAVEDLRVGDLSLTTAGERLPIRWLGHRTLDCRKSPGAFEMRPVRICAGAFGEGRPVRELRVSPGHAICIDAGGEVLIPAAALVNGTTIVQERVDTITYWHVELERHDIVLAENLPCESYLEMGSRAFFVEAAATALRAGPDAPVATHADFCRPFHDRGPIVRLCVSD